MEYENDWNKVAIVVKMRKVQKQKAVGGRPCRLGSRRHSLHVINHMVMWVEFAAAVA